ncbi:biotin carboxylase N-terminal domain-containing protein [Amnibacterium sp. CER49]|uniref:acetyl/propionyl/methylcrotonyl-CoA carboxylase subunit alpha n=1 Tax=Amnibacterium sp. CER49 TaxID=3039161 RepID=UPI002447FF19|nr:biotin carboxylase N-terminal domain-containing protein [Amnibacterium sp. CER49]MDH2445202.1 biotin carboxylase N-terminal domain-containing protein [Amnibacterium sp. CER49]
MFERVLVANRGEIACRVIRTLQRLGIRSVAVYTDADAGAPHTSLADEAVALGSDGYLDPDRIVAAAVRTGADAIHPGYGFLSENARLAAACAEAGVVFVGPSPTALAVMGDKIRARERVEAFGVPVVAGVSRAGLTDDDLVAAIERVGLPALVKPAAGGGGKGMHVVRSPGEVRQALASARREAAAAFGDDTLFVERYLDAPRHIEVQVLADAHGTVLTVADRECTLQRRHQKVIEEAPSIDLPAEVRERMARDARAVAESVDYVGAGTVEFIVPGGDPGAYAFLEMNTRLQVEHPVTEQVTGLDLVALQLHVAAGLPLPLAQEDVRVTGHAIEARVYAEDPATGFLPTGGPIAALGEPGGDGVRVDSGVAAGFTVPLLYDPLLLKVVATAPTRAEALARLTAALERTEVLGPNTNVPFLVRLLRDEDVRAGRLDTGLIERRQAELAAPAEAPDAAALGALVSWAREHAARPAGAWGRTGWRLQGVAASVYRFEGSAPVAVVPARDGLVVRAGDGPERRAAVTLHDEVAEIALDGVRRAVRWATDGRALLLLDGGATHRLVEPPPEALAAAGAEAAPELRSPMPGTVVAVPVDDGADVETGTAVVVVEAMKMEHAVQAPLPGTVEVLVRVGDRVARDQVLARVRQPVRSEA